MRRREFIAGLGAAAAWPVMARAQQAAMPVVGFLSSASADGYATVVTAFRQGLKDNGYVEARNVAVEYRWGGGNNSRLPQLAADLASRHVNVIVANGPSVRPAMTATKTIPIVFVTGVDPLAARLVNSLSHPGGNATGLSLFSGELGAKRLELMREMVPSASVMAILVNPTSPRLEFDTIEIPKQASKLGAKVLIIKASTDSEIEAAFASAMQSKVGALLISSDPYFTTRVDLLASLSAKYRLPTSYSFREFAMAGGLVSYGTNLPDIYRRSASYVARILGGAKPADLPVQQPTKFELVVNLKTAKALGLTIPLSLLGRADEVIE